ncbi:putative thioredoxin [Amaricoccus macauensis]|uniref:Thioredoxin n=1 Tax=Amaricoccus macauensis TaxID=57001 RepID=A0A840SQT1_9RHOB|nr:thioredoxin [Amaricoccus macauensis]MBB5223444.1 putative thioredoxin [Amaricoccus macauensis]
MDLKAPTPAESLVKDGTEATFMADVVEASVEVPVIVDFWAPWCGPCKTLGPALEKAVADAKGKVRMVKIDVDQNQRLAAQMRVQSIPAVFAFVGGQPVDGFMGAQTPAQIKAFVDRLIDMSGGNAGLEEAIAAAEEMLAEGAAADAAQTFAAVLQEDEGNLAAIGGLARSHLALGEIEQAKGVLGMTPAGKEGDPAIAAARAQIDLAEASAGASGETADLEARVAADPTDLQARYDLAMARVGAGDQAGAIDDLLELFRRDREWDEGAAKTQLLKLFDSLGPKSEVGQKGRRRLSSMIFA